MRVRPLVMLALFCGSGVGQDHKPTLEETGDFIQRKLSGSSVSKLFSSKEGRCIVAVTMTREYKTFSVSGCAVKMVTMSETSTKSSCSKDLPPTNTVRETGFNFKDITLDAVKAEENTVHLEFSHPLTVVRSRDSVRTETESEHLLVLWVDVSELAQRLSKAFTRAAELCGAKKDVF